MQKKTIIKLVIIFILLIAILAVVAMTILNMQKKQDNNKEILANMEEAVKVENEYKKISPEEAKSKIDNGENIIILDVREQYEYDEGHIPNSILIPLANLEQTIESKIPNKEQTIFVYCRTGSRSEYASNILIQKDYTNIYDLGGIVDWPYEIEK